MDKQNSKSRAELARTGVERSRSRSRSPRRIEGFSRDKKDLSRHSHHRRDERRRNSTSSSSSDDEKLRYENKRAPPAPTISKISINLKSNKGSSSASGKLQIKLSAPITAKPAVVPLPKPSVASAFNVDSDDEAEEMPPECKMRMKNIGKNTPTSSGPNSFGKTKIGFVDSKKIFEKKLMEIAKNMGD